MRTSGLSLSANNEGIDSDVVEDELDLRRILKMTLLGIGGLILAMMVVTYAFRSEILALGKDFVDILGPWGVALGWFLPDAFTLPIPADAINMLAMTGGMPFWTIAAFASLGSIVGGCLGFRIGLFVGNRSWFKRFMGRRGAEVDRLMRRYGPTAVLAAVLTPVPYSIACLGAGALNMRFRTFFLISLLRAPRVAFYLLLIDRGVLQVVF
jgi:membrane protein YqaA with SNARE-associated domain